MTPVVEVGRRFAAALDAEDYDAVRALLADSCVYRKGAELHTGAEAVVASYQRIGNSARDRFDKLEYTSAVTARGDNEAAIEFTDRITHGGATHVYRCRQRIRTDGAGRIERIEHEELPGERERLNAFLVSLSSTP